MATPDLRAAHDLEPAVVGWLEEQLYEFNARATGYVDGEGLAFLAEAESQIVGAAAGYSWGGIAELRQVWVSEPYRRRGLGAALLTAALAEARRRGCSDVFLSTYDFQAPQFYARFGFTTVATIEGKPRGRREFVMRLGL